jgi:hypothetical protein
MAPSPADRADGKCNSAVPAARRHLAECKSQGSHPGLHAIAPLGLERHQARKLLCLSLLALLLLAGCSHADPTPPDVIARLDGESIRYPEIESYVARTVGDSDKGLGSDVLSELLDQFLDERLTLRLARDKGLVGKGETDARAAAEALLRDGKPGDPPEAEIARYYREHAADFTRPERVRVRQILTDDRKAAESALREIAAGADFGELARRVSRDPSAASGGYQGELAREDLPPAFADVIFSLKPGEVSRIVPAEYGFHLFQAVTREPAGVVPLDQARGEIVERLREKRGDERLAELVRRARDQYNVVVYERNLPFDYRGSYR